MSPLPETTGRLGVQEIVELMGRMAAAPTPARDPLVAYMLDAWTERTQDAVFWARATCRARGYALAVHGSLRRDVDVVAVPWTDEAIPAAALAHAILDRLVELGLALGWDACGAAGTAKPNGRHAWGIVLAGEPFCFLDLSVVTPMSDVYDRVEALKYAPPLAADQSIWNGAINTCLDVISRPQSPRPA